ncbi:Hypothetical protein R9X50_00408200 [Acrodontium crateriforme]|uniref:C2H2-type domain-containing protein n=1 Tax=Acrodontium crateriforme TaxID=150365 RepID=A0AAQ3RAG3_9PEZI|nr:Hypothetical protein R9X50_00408200 [Acrodontium crateriforme]
MSLDDILALVKAGGDYRPPAEEIAGRPYVQRMRRFCREWIQFCTLFDIPCDDLERPLSSQPSFNHARAFLTWQCRQKRGAFGEKISLRTAQKYWTEFRLEVFRQSGDRYSRKQIMDMDNYILVTLRGREMLTTHARPKLLADGPVVRDVLHYFWVCDEYTYEHPRTRAQITFAIVVMHYLGLRPGEIVESTAHRRTNEGIHYRDLKILMFADEVGHRRFAIKLHVRNRKGRRDRDDLVEAEVLTEDRENRQMCPVTIFMAFAISDGAIAGVKCASDLDRIPFVPGQTTVELPISKEKENTPILRRNKGVHDDWNIMQYNDLRRWLGELGKRAGYEGPLTPYALRRGFGNQIDKVVSSVQRRRQMGHKNDDTFMAYISQISGIHCQNIMAGKAPDQKAVDFLRSMRTGLNTTRTVAGSSLTDSRFWRTKDTCSSSNDANSDLPLFGDNGEEYLVTQPFSETIRREPPSRQLVAYLRYDKCRAEVAKLFAPSVATTPIMSLSKAVETWLGVTDPDPGEVYYPGSEPDPTTGDCLHCQKQAPKSGSMSREWKWHLLWCHRQALGEQQLYVSAPESRETTTCCEWDECRASIDSADVGALGTHVSRHLRELMVTCLWEGCGVGLATHNGLRSHLECEHGICLPSRATKKSLPPPVNFCFECAEYFFTKSSWQNHCAWHVESATLYCGSITRYHLTMTPYCCPFCLGSGTYRPFHRREMFLRHLWAHITKEEAWPIKCQHPLCNGSMDDKRDFWEHMDLVHGIDRPRKDQDCDSGPATSGKSPESSEEEFFDAVDKSIIEEMEHDEPEAAPKATSCEAPNCDSRFNNMGELRAHWQVHAPRYCAHPSCFKSFATLKEAIIHQTNVHKTSTWMCDLPSKKDPDTVCNLPCRDRWSLRAHRKTHPGYANYAKCANHVRPSNPACSKRRSFARTASTFEEFLALIKKDAEKTKPRPQARTEHRNANKEEHLGDNASSLYESTDLLPVNP